MTETTVGREPLQIVEIVQPYCINRYGIAPCTALLGVTGSEKCFNTRISCQDTANYNQSGDIVWRFIKPQANRTPDIYEESGDDFKTMPIPSLMSTSTSPTRINVGGGSENESPFGRRASATITFQDHPWDDSVGDFYVDERSYVATDRGTFWGKWIARNPFHNGYTVNVYDGYVGQDLSAMNKRTYLLDKIEGPDSSGRVRITAKDPLRLADDKRALAPSPTDATLRDAIDSTQTSGIIFVGLEADVSEQIGNTGTTRYVRVDDEIIEYTGYTTGATNEHTLTGVTRAALGTEAGEHGSGEAMQRVIRYDDYDTWLVAEDMLNSYTNVDPAFIPSADWALEGQTWLTPFSVTGTISEPTPVNELLGELTEQCLFYMWWDERAQEIKIKAIRPEVSAPTELNDDLNIIADSPSMKYDPEQRISRVIVYYNKRNPTESEDDIGNYANVNIRIEGDAESDDQYGESRTRRIFSRWLTSNAQASTVAFRLLAKYVNNPRYLTLRLDAKDRSLWTADVAEITTRTNQDLTGASKAERWQVISAEEIQPGEMVQYDLQTFEFKGRYAFYTDDGVPDYSDATDEQRNSSVSLLGWYSDDDGLMSDGSEGYRYI